MRKSNVEAHQNKQKTGFRSAADVFFSDVAAIQRRLGDFRLDEEQKNVLF